MPTNLIASQVIAASNADESAPVEVQASADMEKMVLSLDDGNAIVTAVLDDTGFKMLYQMLSLTMIERQRAAKAHKPSKPQKLQP